MRARSLVLLGMVALLAAMSGLAGFVDWPKVLEVGTAAGFLLLLIVLVIAILIVLPTVTLLCLVRVIDWLTTPTRKPAGTVPRGAP